MKKVIFCIKKHSFILEGIGNRVKKEIRLKKIAERNKMVIILQNLWYDHTGVEREQPSDPCIYEEQETFGRTLFYKKYDKMREKKDEWDR